LRSDIYGSCGGILLFTPRELIRCHSGGILHLHELSAAAGAALLSALTNSNAAEVCLLFKLVCLIGVKSRTVAQKAHAKLINKTAAFTANIWAYQQNNILYFRLRFGEINKFNPFGKRGAGFLLILII